MSVCGETHLYIKKRLHQVRGSGYAIGERYAAETADVAKFSFEKMTKMNITHNFGGQFYSNFDTI